MAPLTFQPIPVRTGCQDQNGRLVLLDGELIAVLVRLDDAIHGQDQGKWFLEAGFSLVSLRTHPFDDLDEAKAWLEAQLDL